MVGTPELCIVLQVGSYKGRVDGEDLASDVRIKHTNTTISLRIGHLVIFVYGNIMIHIKFFIKMNLNLLYTYSL